MLKVLAVSLLFTASASQAAPIRPEAFNGKLDYEMTQVSRGYAKESYPSVRVDTYWSDAKYIIKGFHPYRHMHAMVVAAFYSKRKDQQAGAWSWLVDYNCENAVACADYVSFFEGAQKANILKMKTADRKLSEETLARARARLKSMPEIARKGLCPQQADRADWFSQEYTLYCPSIAAMKGQNAGGFIEKVGMDSHQAIMSSSFVKTFDHQGPADCSAPWKAVLECGVTEKTHTLNCAREGDGLPFTVKCQEL